MSNVQSGIIEGQHNFSHPTVNLVLVLELVKISKLFWLIFRGLQSCFTD